MSQGSRGVALPGQAQGDGCGLGGALPNVRVVVALGKIGFDAYLQMLKGRGVVPRPKPAFGHGSVDVLPNGQILIGSYHPSRQNTNTGRLTPRMMDAVFSAARKQLRRK